MSAHTPGEWIRGYSDQAEVEFNGSGHYITLVSGERDCPVAFVLGMDRPYYDDPETEANARLISAAPDLLEQLNVAVLHMETLHSLLPAVSTARSELMGRIKKARSAIARATLQDGGGG